MARTVVTENAGAYDANGVALGILASGAAAGGDLGGTFPNPTLAAIGAATGPVGDTTHAPSVTIDTKGRVTSLTSNAISFPADAVSSVFTRTGAVVATTGDYTAAQVGALASTSTVNAIATANATSADWSNNSHKITSLANGASAQDAAAFGQIPTALPPNGAAGGALNGTYPNPGMVVLPPQHQATGVLGNFFLSSSLSFLTMANAPVATEARLCMGTPLILPYAITINKVGCYIGTAGSAGAVLRLGIYQITTANPYGVVLSSAYASLIYDAGTMAATGTGQTTITLGVAQVIPAYTPFAVAFVAQGTPVTTARVYRETSGVTGGGYPWGQVGILINTPSLGVYVGSISGALPATFTPTTAEGSGAGAWFSRSA